MKKKGKAVNPNAQEIENVKAFGKSGQGRTEYLDYLEGKHISYKQRCLAQCYQCMGYYKDGKVSCGCRTCALFTIMPYKDKVED